MRVGGVTGVGESWYYRKWVHVIHRERVETLHYTYAFAEVA